MAASSPIKISTFTLPPSSPRRAVAFLEQQKVQQPKVQPPVIDAEGFLSQGAKAAKPPASVARQIADAGVLASLDVHRPPLHVASPLPCIEFS